MADQQETSTDTDLTPEQIEALKGNKSRGTWALIIGILVFFQLFSWIMTSVFPAS